jgi:hypothetical protein
MARGKKASIVLKKEGGKAVPVSAFDAEQFDKHPDGTEFDLAPRTKRSSPQQRLYWSILSKIVSATDLFATPEHLHDALLRDLGYITVLFDLHGTPYVTRDSTAFDSMTASEFKEYMDKALARLAEVLGFDPMDAIGDEQAAA